MIVTGRLEYRESIIWEITRIDTISYRNVGMQITGSYTHEPSGFRSELYDIYNSLSDYNLMSLYKLKVQSLNKDKVHINEAYGSLIELEKIEKNNLPF
jgi:hypothetical protein